MGDPSGVTRPLVLPSQMGVDSTDKALTLPAGGVVVTSAVDVFRWLMTLAWSSNDFCLLVCGIEHPQVNTTEDCRQINSDVVSHTGNTDPNNYMA